jgi:excisionase family DNA binding protein
MTDYLSPEQAATYLNISKSTLAKRRIYGGGPRFIKVGAAVRYAKADLDLFMAEHSVASTSESWS